MPKKKRNDRPLLDKYLAANGLARVDIIGDGSCLFRSVAQLMYGSQDDHLVLRLRCAKFIYAHREDFEPFLDTPFIKYVQSICCPHNLAGNIELEALSRLLDVEITVISTETVPLTFGEGRKKQIKLAYINGNHYDAVLPKEEAEALRPILHNFNASAKKAEDFMDTVAAQNAFAYFADDDQVTEWFLNGIETEEVKKQAIAEKNKEKISLGFNFAESEKDKKGNDLKKATHHTLSKNFIDPLDMQRIDNIKIIETEKKENQERLERLEKERLEMERLEMEQKEKEEKELETKDDSLCPTDSQNKQSNNNDDVDATTNGTSTEEPTNENNLTESQHNNEIAQSDNSQNTAPRKKGNPKKRYRQNLANNL